MTPKIPASSTVLLTAERWSPQSVEVIDMVDGPVSRAAAVDRWSRPPGRKGADLRKAQAGRWTAVRVQEKTGLSSALSVCISVGTLNRRHRRAADNAPVYPIFHPHQLPDRHIDSIDLGSKRKRFAEAVGVLWSRGVVMRGADTHGMSVMAN